MSDENCEYCGGWESVTIQCHDNHLSTRPCPKCLPWDESDLTFNIKELDAQLLASRELCRELAEALEGLKPEFDICNDGCPYDETGDAADCNCVNGQARGALASLSAAELEKSCETCKFFDGVCQAPGCFRWSLDDYWQPKEPATKEEVTHKRIS